MAFRVACLQLNSSDSMEENIRQAESLLVSAVSQGSDLLLLPENAFWMRDPTRKISATAYCEANHPGVLACREWAAITV